VLEKKLAMLRAIVTAYPKKRENGRPESTLLVPESPSVVAQQYRLKNTDALRPHI
jgi:hypothetical protein